VLIPVSLCLLLLLTPPAAIPPFLPLALQKLKPAQLHQHASKKQPRNGHLNHCKSGQPGSAGLRGGSAMARSPAPAPWPGTPRPRRRGVAPAVPARPCARVAADAPTPSRGFAIGNPRRRSRSGLSGAYGSVRAGCRVGAAAGGMRGARGRTMEVWTPMLVT
jgi:hypothetical protein